MFLQGASTEKIFQEKRSGVDAGRPEPKRCLEYLREGDTLLVTKIDRLARSTSDLYRIIPMFAEKGVSFRVTDDPSIDTTSRTGKLVMGILALIAEFENDIRRERQMDGIAKAKGRGVSFGRKRELTPERIQEIKILRGAGAIAKRLNLYSKDCFSLWQSRYARDSTLCKRLKIWSARLRKAGRGCAGLACQSAERPM
jgi:DNA invertase Pin-like site-specific DNA recombinase